VCLKDGRAWNTTFMTFELIALAFAISVAGVVCLAILFARDAKHEGDPAPVRVRRDDR
jgi:hypothetical protein